MNSVNVLIIRFRLVHAVKPHTDKITSMITSPNHNLIVTLSDDNTAFFFKFGISTSGSIVLEPCKCLKLPEKCLNFFWRRMNEV